MVILRYFGGIVKFIILRFENFYISQTFAGMNPTQFAIHIQFESIILVWCVTTMCINFTCD
jgi:hypothetical protein